MVSGLAQLTKCLWCVWPLLVCGVGWFMARMVEGKTYYGSLTPGVDPASPQGQQEFETRRQRDKEKRRIIYWVVGIIAVGFAGALLWNTFTIKVKAAPEIAETLQATSLPASRTPALDLPTHTPAPRLSHSPVKTLQATSLPASLTPYPSTPTPKTIFVAGPKITVVVTVVVERIQVVTVVVERTRVVTATPSWTHTPTPSASSTPTVMPSPSASSTPTVTASETMTETLQATALPPTETVTEVPTPPG